VVRPAAAMTIVCILVGASPALAQTTQPATRPSPGQQWKLDNSAGIKALDAGLLDEADRHFHAAMEDAAGFAPLDARRALTVCNLGVVLARRHRMAEALALYQQAMNDYEQTLPENDFRKAIALDNIADASLALGRAADAEAAAERALKIYQAMTSPADVRLMVALERLGNVRSIRGEYEQARPLFREALQIDEENHQQQSVGYAGLIDELALTYFNQRDYKDAQPLLEQALPIAEKNAPKFPQTHLRTLALLGSVYEYQGRFSDAQTVLAQAIEIDQKKFPHDPSLANLMSLQAVAVAVGGDYEQAESLYKQAIALRESLHLKRDPELIAALSGYATLLHQMGRPDDAKAIEQRLAAITGKSTTRPTTQPAMTPTTRPAPTTRHSLSPYGAPA